MDYRTERMIYQISETRNKILEHAEKMFIEKGLFETTMSNLAQTIGIKPYVSVPVLPRQAGAFPCHSG